MWHIPGCIADGTTSTPRASVPYRLRASRAEIVCAALMFAEFASVTEAVKAKSPVCEVVPEITSAPRSNEKPCDSHPLAICQWYGATPPVTDRFELCGVPAVPAGSGWSCMASLTKGDTVTSEVGIKVLSAALVAVTVACFEEDTRARSEEAGSRHRSRRSRTTPQRCCWWRSTLQQIEPAVRK